MEYIYTTHFIEALFAIVKHSEARRWINSNIGIQQKTSNVKNKQTSTSCIRTLSAKEAYKNTCGAIISILINSLESHSYIKICKVKGKNEPKFRREI